MPSQSAGPVAQDAKGRSARWVSAFFGFDHAQPRKANLLCPGAAGQDGMPVILSHTIDPRTLQRDDFAVVTRAGAENAPFYVTLAPAVGAGELRTVLLVGELGSASDPPQTVRIVGDLLSDGATGGTVNIGACRGASSLSNGGRRWLGRNMCPGPTGQAAACEAARLALMGRSKRCALPGQEGSAGRQVTRWVIRSAHSTE
jgi:hypothetical protein